MIYDLESDTELSGSDKIYEDNSPGYNPKFENSAEQYVEFFKGTIDPIFLFVLDFESNSEDARRMEEFFEDEDSHDRDNFKDLWFGIEHGDKFPRQGQALRYTFLNKFPKIKSIVESRLSEFGYDLSEAIVIFTNKGSGVHSVVGTRDPAFLMHDIYHIFDDISFTQNNVKIKDILFDYYGKNYYVNDVSLKDYLVKRYGEHGAYHLLSSTSLAKEILLFDFHNLGDWINHLFAYSLYKKHGIIRPLSEIKILEGDVEEGFDPDSPALKLRFVPSRENSSPEDFVFNLETKISDKSHELLDYLLGSVIFNFT